MKHLLTSVKQLEGKTILKVKNNYFVTEDSYGEFGILDLRRFVEIDETNLIIFFELGIIDEVELNELKSSQFAISKQELIDSINEVLQTLSNEKLKELAYGL